MKLAVLTVPLLLLAGCDGCSTPPQQSAPAPELSHLLEGPPPEVAQPAAIYRAAYNEAKKEITEENAASRLDAIERAIDGGGDDEDRE